MIGEFNLYGIYFPWLLVLGVVTLGVAGPCAGCWPGPACTGWCGTRRCSTSRCSWCCFTASPLISPYIFQRLA